MLRTPLYEKLAASGARMGEYAGAETALVFGPHHDTVQHSFDVLRTSCGIYDLGWRAKLVLTGSDRVRWLNGVVTNNIRDLAPDHGNYNFVLSPQGRIQADCYVYNRGEYLLVGTELNQAPRVKEIFDKYIIMDDVEVTDISDKLTAIGIQGPEARNILQRAGFSGLDVGPMQLRDITWSGTPVPHHDGAVPHPRAGEAGARVGKEDSPVPHVRVGEAGANVGKKDSPVPHVRAGEAGANVGVLSEPTTVGLTITRMAGDHFLTYELWCSPDNIGAVWDALVSAGATPVGTDALELFRIASGVPKFGTDIRDRDLPQETNQSHALHFAKGCYIGQEIVERIRSRGQVHRLFTGFDIEGAIEMVDHPRQESRSTVHDGAQELTSHLELSFAGTKLTRDGKEIGEITSAALVDGRILALGYVRREHSAPGTQLQAGDSIAVVEQLPFAEAKHAKSQLVTNS